MLLGRLGNPSIAFPAADKVIGNVLGGKRQRGSGRDVWASQDGFWVDPLAVGCDRANPGL
jgi:hypothetical protein